MRREIIIVTKQLRLKSLTLAMETHLRSTINALLAINITQKVLFNLYNSSDAA